MLPEPQRRFMDPDDSDRFCVALASMGRTFGENLSEDLQLDYWDALYDEMIIDEWEAVVRRVKKEHTFRKVPLPAELIAYAKDARRPKTRPYMG